ncbi:MAG: hypothetical protein AAF995_02585 [Planctomycetota bacterium]
MNARAAVVLGLVGSIAFLGGCRTERTSGQRHQVRAIDAVLQAELDRLDADPAASADDYRDMVDFYSRLTNAAVRSGNAEPHSVQSAEDDLVVLAREARGLPAFQTWNADAQVNFERQFWRNRLMPWQMWRGPGHQTNREFTADAGE